MINRAINDPLYAEKLAEGAPTPDDEKTKTLDTLALMQAAIVAQMTRNAIGGVGSRSRLNQARPNEATKRYHEESKKRRKMAAKSRKLNRRK